MEEFNIIILQIGERLATRYVIILNKENRNGKERYYQHEAWVNIYTNYLRMLFINFQKHYQFWVNQDQKFLTSFQNLRTLQK